VRSRRILVSTVALFCLAGFAPAGQGRACRILLTNDDGVQAPGLLAAYDSLSQLCEVVISAPTANRSGASHAIFNTKGTKVSAITLDGRVKAWSVDGSPAEAAAVGVSALGGGKPFDLVVSGINQGENLGLVNLYSGTVNAALEGAVRGVPGIAVSLESGKDYKDYVGSARITRQLVEQALRHPIPKGVAINVNIPKGVPRGVRVVRAGGQPWTFDGFDAEPQGGGVTIYKARIRPLPKAEGTGDVAAFNDGYITLTPLAIDRTAQSALGPLRTWRLTPQD
jgi:5'-nucleotidase